VCLLLTVCSGCVQATECLSLLPGSTAVQEQLASIAAAGKLQKFGLDLAPLQLQQLREQAASGGAKVLEQASQGKPSLFCHWMLPCAAAHPAWQIDDETTLRRVVACCQRCCMPSYHPCLQLVSEHPQLAAADSGALAQVGAALGLAPQQQLPLLLRAAEAAHMSGDVVRAQRLLLLLAEQHHK
jgi:hypothetical protein